MVDQRPKKQPNALVANIPFQIEAEWNQRYAHLAGFPLNIAYTGQRAADADAQPHPAAACYWFDPGTYSEDEQLREMWYFPREESPYRIRVTVHKVTGVWETFKYRREELLCTANGPDFRTAMLHTTIVGLQADEPESDSSR